MTQTIEEIGLCRLSWKPVYKIDRTGSPRETGFFSENYYICWTLRVCSAPMLATMDIKWTFLDSQSSFWMATQYRYPLESTDCRGSNGSSLGVHSTHHNKYDHRSTITDGWESFTCIKAMGRLPLNATTPSCTFPLANGALQCSMQVMAICVCDTRPGKNFQSLFAHNTHDQPLALRCWAPYNARSPLVFREGTLNIVQNQFCCQSCNEVTCCSARRRPPTLYPGYSICKSSKIFDNFLASMKI